MTIKETFEAYMTLSSETPGSGIDVLMLTVLGNFIYKDYSLPAFMVPVDAIGDMEKMLEESDKSFILCYDGLFCIMAYYNHSDIMPLGRAYCFTGVDHKAHLRFLNDVMKKGLKIISLKDFHDIVDMKNYPDRLNRYLEKKQEDMSLSYFSGLVDGRVDRTSVNQGIYLSTQNCFICNKPVDVLAFSTMASTESGVMISCKLCKEHYTESLSYANTMDYIYSKSDCDFFYKTKPLTTDELLTFTEDTVKREWCCEVVSVIGKTITARRESCVKIVLRLDSLVNYAYVILDPAGKEYCRYDSAQHHKVPYGPDHIHFKKEITSSFTTGIPSVDMKSILNKVIECESVL